MIFINSISTFCGNILNIDQFRGPIKITLNNSLVVVSATLENHQQNMMLFEANVVVNVTIYGKLRIALDNSTKQDFIIKLLNSKNNNIFSNLKVFFNDQEIIDSLDTNEISIKYENNAKTPSNTLEQLVSRKVIFAQVSENRTYFTNDSTQQCYPNNYSSVTRKLAGCLLSQFNLDGSCVSSCTTSKPYISINLTTCSSACAPSNKILVVSPSEIRCLSACPKNYKQVSQSMYLSYQQCVNDYNISNIDDYCDWVENSRVWNVSRICNKHSQLRLNRWFNQQSQQEGSQDINMEVVNVLGLGQNGSVFSLLNLQSGSFLNNAHFILACTMDMVQPQNSVLQKLFVSLFDQVYGSVRNVFVSGRIDIVNLNPMVTNSLVLSRMFGNVLVPLSQRTGGQSIFINVSSNLQYFVNGVEITADNQTVSGLAGVSIRYVNSFEEAMTAVELGQSPSLYIMNVGVPTYSIQQMVANQQLYQTPATVLDRADSSINLLIYTKFDPAVQQNAFKDYYLNAHLRLEEQKFQIANMAKYTFGIQHTVIDNLSSRQNIRFVVFTSETKAVLLKDNSFMIICDNRLLVDTSSLKCITRASCTGYILNATCLRQCPLDHWFVTIGSKKLCFLKCPTHLNYYNTTNLIGAVDPRTSQCTLCSGNIAREGDCKNDCLIVQNLFTFKQGCFAACPFGTIQTGNSCTSPISVSQCVNNYIQLSDYSSSQYFDICANQVPSYMFTRNQYVRTVLWTCSGKVTMSRVCDTNTVQCSQNSGLSATPVTNISGSLQLCQLSCISGYLNSSNRCTNTCPDLYYSQKITGNCLQCQTNDYDNGQFWDRATQKCVISCQYINQTQPAKACESVTDSDNCPFKSELSQINQFECLTDCPANRFVQSDYCRKSCYIPMSMYVQADNMTCASTCAAGQFIIVSYPLNVFCVVSCPMNYIIISQSIYGTYQQCVPVAECSYYLDLQSKICSTSSCSESNGFYEIDGSSNKICNLCDGTQGGALMKYKTELICSSTPCSYFINLADNQCSIGSCSETGGNNITDGSGNKICQTGCAQGYKSYNGNCYEFCPAVAPYLQLNEVECDVGCNGQTIYQVGDQKNCLTSCDPSNFLGQAEAVYQICVNCTSEQIAQRSDNQCILRSNCVYFNSDPPVCESGLGLSCPKILVRDANTFFCQQNCTGYLEYQNQCYSKCPVNTIMDVSGTTCVTTCSFYRLVTFSSFLQPLCQSDTCSDFQYVDPQYHSLITGCFSTCPAGTLKTRTNTCVKDCVIFDVHPSPTYCEIPGTPSCLYFRKNSGKIIIYTCVACTSQEFLNGFECVSNCDGQFMVKLSNKSICQSICGSFPKGYTEETFNSVSVNVCQDTCPPEFPHYDSVTLLGTQRCFASNCGPSEKYLETNQKCVSMCASGNYFINVSSTNRFQCQDANQSCDRYYKNDGMKECYSVCPLMYPFLNRSECLKSCDPYMNDQKSPTQKLCLSSCSGVNPPYTLTDADGRTQCTSSCGDLFVQQAGKKFSCVSFCQFYTWDGSSKLCTSTCEYYRIDSAKDSQAKWCADSCAALNMIYSVADESVQNQCVSSCPAAYPFLDETVCKNYCQFIIEQQITDVSQFKCQAAPCAKFYQFYPTDSSIRICRQNCVGSALYVFGSQCVSNCGLTANKYVGMDGLTCFSSCSGETAMNETAPVWFCDSKCDFYANSGARTCSSAGTASYPYRHVYQQIMTNGVTTTRHQYVASCPNNEYAAVGGIFVCQTCTFYELVGAAHRCVSSCSASQVQFKYQCFTGLCKDIVGVGSSFYSGVDKKCSQTCGDYFVYDQVSFQCSSTCPANSVYFVSGGQQICSSLCTGTNDYVTLDFRYAINGVGQCVQVCPIGSFKELLQDGGTYKYCASQCAEKQYKVVTGEQTCVSACPVYAMEADGVKRCYDSCGDSTLNKIQVVISGSETQCVSLCPPSHPFMVANGDLECIQICPNLFYSLVGNVRKCLDSCSLNTSVEISFSVPNHQLCTGACGAQQMFLRDSGSVGTCFEVCSLSKNYYDSNRECQSECVPKVYRIDGAQKQCVASCSPPYIRIVLDNDYHQCNIICQGATPYTKLDNICVSLCPAGTYLHDLICKLSCPLSMKYALFNSGHHICSTTCLSQIFSSHQTGAQNLFCQDSCLSQNLFRNDVSSGYTQCLTQCDIGEYQHSTRECNAQNCLQDPANKFVSNWVCLLVCPDFVDLSDYSCKATCSGRFSGYVQQVVMGQNSRVCHQTCPTNFIDLRGFSQYKSAGVCVTYCPKTETLYQEPFSATQFYCTQKCSGANMFVQPDLVYCGNTCTSTFFQQNETGHNFCISSCGMPLGRLSIYGITQCIVCPKYVSEVDQACLSTCDFSNASFGAQICRMAGGARNPATCPVYTNNIAPFLCILDCFTMRDGSWCVQDCSVTGKRFVPESGFDCASSCPYFYEFQHIFGVKQPRCNTTCNYMRSTADVKECQRYCYSNFSLFIQGLTYCSNCSINTTLFVSNLQFSCSQSNCFANQISQNICTDLNCDTISVYSDVQHFTGFVCYDNFSFNYSTPMQTLQVSGVPVSAISSQGDFGMVLLQNGSALHFDGSTFTKTSVSEAVQLQSLTLPPYHDSLHPIFMLKNGSILSSQLLERTDFLSNEAVKNMTGLDLNGKSGVNYLLTDKSLYFRGSCELDMCGRDQSGNAFQKLFNNKPFVHGMWTLIDLQKTGFSFDAGEIKEISAFGLALLFTLKSGQKYAWGYNFNGRLCDANVDQIVISNFSAYDQISVSNNASVMSVGQTVFYCGASLSQDAFDFSTVVSTPTQLELIFSQIMGWKFSDNTIVGISSVQNGFVLRTKAQIFGVGKCVAFGCINFNGHKVLYSETIQLLKQWTTALMVSGNSMSFYTFIFNCPQPLTAQPLIQRDDDPHTDFIQIQNQSHKFKRSYLIVIFVIVDVLAIICIILISVKIIRRHYIKKNETVQVSVQGIQNPEMLEVPLPDYSIETVNVKLSSQTQNWDDDFGEF
ncbi:Conserved_hypothetical protein [Hexamita inflata]|uniref:Transmembrane protein n=1 Tax=Hexamita inflata TaxID=28002 RepID=A0AA86QBQ0_9EUKA|nr:Conserved hypothetical protein [Hexamita inflata]